MIRHSYICNKVLEQYKQLPQITFPIEPQYCLSQIHNCRIMSYTNFAELNRCSLYDVFCICQSESGCTNYDVANDRYLVLFNSSTKNNNVSGRIRWTLAHELGHIVLKHLERTKESSIAEHNINNSSNPTLETEADHFAALLLAPMPLYDQLGIQSASDVQRVFGLSCIASNIRWREYIKWKHSHRKTAWENDMKRLYSQFAG